MKIRSDEDERSRLYREDDVSSFIMKHHLLLGLRPSAREKDSERVTAEGREMRYRRIRDQTLGGGGGGEF